MGINHNGDWHSGAEAAMKRRQEKNTPWPKTEELIKKVEESSCLGCGDKRVSVVYPNLCDKCIKQAYDVLTDMEK